MNNTFNLQILLYGNVETFILSDEGGLKQQMTKQKEINNNDDYYNRIRTRLRPFGHIIDNTYI